MTQETETKTFDEAYVKDLRGEAAGYRVKARDLEEQLTAQQERYNAFTQKLLDREIEYAAKALDVVDPQTVKQLIDKSQFEMDEEGNFKGVQEAISSLVENKPFLKGGTVGKPSNPSNGNGQPQTFSRSQVDKMSSEEINANWNEIQDQMTKGLIR